MDSVDQVQSVIGPLQASGAGMYSELHQIEKPGDERGSRKGQTFLWYRPFLVMRESCGSDCHAPP